MSSTSAERRRGGVPGTDQEVGGFGSIVGPTKEADPFERILVGYTTSLGHLLAADHPERIRGGVRKTVRERRALSANSTRRGAMVRAK